MGNLFKTSDGNLFYTHNAAYNHARTLEDKTIEAITQEAAPLNASVEVPEAGSEEKVSTDEGDTSSEEEDADEEKVENDNASPDSLETNADDEAPVDIQSLTVPELKDLATKQGLTFKSRATRDEMIQLLTQN